MLAVLFVVVKPLLLDLISDLHTGLTGNLHIQKTAQLLQNAGLIEHIHLDIVKIVGAGLGADLFTGNRVICACLHTDIKVSIHIVHIIRSHSTEPVGTVAALVVAQGEGLGSAGILIDIFLLFHSLLPCS